MPLYILLYDYKREREKMERKRGGQDEGQYTGEETKTEKEKREKE